jgi:uncharacterized pyridoxamine 5'-phosphate oxidase family protein
MQRVVDFLQKQGFQYFATVGLDGKPKVRPFQMIYHDGGKLIYCTGAKKTVYQEIVANPHVEICISTGNRWLRISGRVAWIEDKSVKEKILAANALVASIYKSADNPDLAAFYLADAVAVFTDFSGAPPEVIKL